MPLKRVTITGADDNTDPKLLEILSNLFPFVEWGILISENGEGNPRYPTAMWLREFTSMMKARTPRANVSLHLCGQYTRSYMTGGNMLKKAMPDLWELAGRFQLNTHGEPVKSPASIAGLKYTLDQDHPKPCIIQLDGVNDQLFRTTLSEGFKVMPLFDESSGTGISPQWWPLARFHEDGSASAERENLVSHGYAGGLGPENIESQLPAIHRASCGARYWIDMETQVRTPGDSFNSPDVLDIEKVGQVLFQCQQFMYQQTA